MKPFSTRFSRADMRFGRLVPGGRPAFPGLLFGFMLGLDLGMGQARPHSLGLVTASTGTWTTYGRLQGFNPEAYTDELNRYAFNKILSLGIYGKAFGQPAHLAIPWAWTAKHSDRGSEHRLALGDAELYLGRKLRFMEARLGLIFPAGYAADPARPWIGPGNTQVTVGAAINSNFTRYSRRWEMSAEAKWAYALDDAIAKAGSWGLYPSGKIAFRPRQEWKVGLEALGHWKSSYWGRSATLGQSVLGQEGPKAQWSAGLAPVLFAENFRTKNLALGCKAGHSLWGYRDAVSYNASIYLLYFP